MIQIKELHVGSLKGHILGHNSHGFCHKSLFLSYMGGHGSPFLGAAEARMSRAGEGEPRGSVFKIGTYFQGDVCF